jgi:hypothetical protein
MKTDNSEISTVHGVQSSCTSGDVKYRKSGNKGGGACSFFPYCAHRINNIRPDAYERRHVLDDATKLNPKLYCTAAFYKQFA